MKRPLKHSIVLTLAGGVALAVVAAPAAGFETLQDPPQGVSTQFTPFTQAQLDDLVAPVALYADPLLAQVLLAATFPDQIADAAAYVRANGTEGIDDQYWDVSVKAVAHYPTVLNLMDTRRDWATSLGQAYAGQSSEVMRAVQTMRQRAQAQGNLQSTPEQQVVVEREYIRIWPAQPQVIYVPVYDPIVYYEPVFYRPGFHLSFSFGLPFRIGSWLIYDLDWWGRRIYYTGWSGGGWIARSRPHIHITNIYVNPGYRRVWYDRDVLYRRPDYGRGFAWARNDAGRGVARAGETWRTAVPRDGQRGIATTSRTTATARDGENPPRWTPSRSTPTTGGPTRMSRPAEQAAPPRWTPPEGGPTRTARPVETPPSRQPSGSDQPRTGYGIGRVAPATGSGGPRVAPPTSRSQSSAPGISRAPRAESDRPSVSSGGYRAPRAESGSGQGSARAMPRSSAGGSSGQGSARAAPRSSSGGGSGSARAQARARSRD